MIVNYLPSFIRDLKALKKTPIYATLRQTAFEEIPAYNSIDQIPDLKKIKGYDQAYRIRVGDYRIGIFIEDAPEGGYTDRAIGESIFNSSKSMFKPGSVNPDGRMGSINFNYIICRTCLTQ